MDETGIFYLGVNDKVSHQRDRQHGRDEQQHVAYRVRRLDLRPLGAIRCKQSGVLDFQLIVSLLQFARISYGPRQAAQLVQREAKRVGSCSSVIKQRVRLRAGIDSADVGVRDAGLFG